jgi:transcriptional regulator with XRE-family HTH domain
VEAIRRRHAESPIAQRPAGTINRASFTAILSLAARFKVEREREGRKLADERMGIDATALSRLEIGKILTPRLATLHQWAEALGRKLDVELKAE